MTEKKIRYINVFVLFFSIFFMCSCSSSQMSVESLIKAPKLTGKFYEIEQALKSIAGENITLKYPKSGDYRFPFVLYDIDLDGQEEAIVFYSDNKIENEIKFNVLDQVSGAWKSIFSAVGQGVDIEKILISNIIEGSVQILLNWSKPNGTDHSLQIYNSENNTLKCIYNKDYLTDVFVFDLDNDSKDEIIIIDKTLKITPRVEVIKKINSIGELDEVFYTRLISSSADYKKIIMGQLSEGINAIFLDSQLENPDNSDDILIYTEIITFDKNKQLVNLFYNSNSDKNSTELFLTSNTRSQDIYCKDINLDNIIEIPQSLFYHFELNLEDKKKLFPLVVWQNYKTGYLNISDLSLENNKDGYSFVFPNNWYKIVQDQSQEQNIVPLVVAVYDKKNHEMTFKTNDSVSRNIMTIKTLKITDESTSNTNNLTGYLELKRKNNFIYYVKIENKNKYFNINLETIKKLFSITYKR